MSPPNNEMHGPPQGYLSYIAAGRIATSMNVKCRSTGARDLNADMRNKKTGSCCMKASSSIPTFKAIRGASLESPSLSRPTSRAGVSFEYLADEGVLFPRSTLGVVGGGFHDAEEPGPAPTPSTGRRRSCGTRSRSDGAFLGKLEKRGAV